MMGRKSNLLNARRRWLGTLGLLGLVLLFSHQNCAPPSGLKADTAIATEIGRVDIGQPVTIIDDSKTEAALNFPYPEIEFNAGTSNLTINGGCYASQEGATLGWKVLEVSATGTVGQELGKGYASCSSGLFHVNLDSLPTPLACGQRYKIRAQLGFGTPGETIVSRRCPSSASI